MDKEALSTQDRLLNAAMSEFNERGYDGTDSNKIARRAGFAPQTFYRWFSNKAEIFLANYRAWEEDEMSAIAEQRSRRGAAKSIVETIIAHHRSHLGFRRSLRKLAYENELIRKARIESRHRQIARLRGWMGDAMVPDVEAFTLLLQMERLADAVAEGEYLDFGAGEEVAIAELLRLVKRIGGST